MSQHQISCINKSDMQNAHERISHAGGYSNNGTRWKITEAEAIRSIEANSYEFYVSQGGRLLHFFHAL